MAYAKRGNKWGTRNGKKPGSNIGAASVTIYVSVPCNMEYFSKPKPNKS